MASPAENIKHLMVLMMENQSIDHMLGGLRKKYPKINGLNGNESNPDDSGHAGGGFGVGLVIRSAI